MSTFETVGLLLIIGGATYCARRLWLRLVIVFLSAGCLLAMVQMRAPSSVTQLTPFRPADSTLRPGSEYIGSKACRSCHPNAYATWHRSYHRTMTQTASEESVLAPFDGQVLTNAGRTYRVFKEGDTFFVNMPKLQTEGKTPEERLIQPVVMTTGSHHMQAYWIPLPDAGDDVPGGLEAFEQYCEDCHGEDADEASGPYLQDLELPNQLIDEAVLSDTHLSLARRDKGFDLAVEYTKRIQFMSKLTQFPFVYLIKEGRWAHEDHTFLQPPETEHTPEPYGDRWTNGCDQCHSVRPDWRNAYKSAPNESEEEDIASNGFYGPAVAELGIACEACHGPARAHVEHHQNPANRYLAHLGHAAEDPIRQPNNLDHRKSSYVCAQCHAELVIHEDAEDFYPGQDLADYAHVLQYIPDAPPPWLAKEVAEDSNRLNDTFWRDGTIRVAGRNFNGMILSGCYTKSTMGCLTCHSLHNSDPNDQLKAEALSDQVCVDCHPEEGGDVSAHTHHPVGSEGSRCYNCHMPHTTVGLLGLIRSHRVDSPSAQRSLDTGRPNACNLCHLDKTLTSVSEHLAEWYGHDPLDRRPPREEIAASITWLLSGDAVQRATIAWHMGWAPAQEASGMDWQAPFLARTLDDSYSAVRYIAGQALKSLPGYSDFEYDYIGTSARYAQSMKEASEIWSAMSKGVHTASLLVQDGRIDMKTVTSLENDQDNTPVRVNE